MRPKNKPYNIALHGGAGALRPHEYTSKQIREYEECLIAALSKGDDILARGGAATEAVIETVVIMEDSHLFNAGRGSVFSCDETIEMDASVSCGKKIKTGGVTNLTRVKNPIWGAFHVLENSKHALLSGLTADLYCREPVWIMNLYSISKQNIDLSSFTKRRKKILFNLIMEIRLGQLVPSLSIKKGIWPRPLPQAE